jgi:hypothetical protein
MGAEGPEGHVRNGKGGATRFPFSPRGGRTNAAPWRFGERAECRGTTGKWVKTPGYNRVAGNECR